MTSIYVTAFLIGTWGCTGCFGYMAAVGAETTGERLVFGGIAASFLALGVWGLTL